MPTLEDLARAAYEGTIDPAWPDYRSAPPTWERDADDHARAKSRAAARAVVLAALAPLKAAAREGYPSSAHPYLPATGRAIEDLLALHDEAVGEDDDP